jgi:pilus assembly protein CpaF
MTAPAPSRYGTAAYDPTGRRGTAGDPPVSPQPGPVAYATSAVVGQGLVSVGANLTATGVDQDLFQRALELARSAISDQYKSAEIDNPTPAVISGARQKTLDVLKALNDEHIQQKYTVGIPNMLEVAELILAAIFGLGQVEKLVEIEGVEDVVMNGPKEVLIKRNGTWEATDVTFTSSGELLTMINRAIAHTGQQAGARTPIIDAVLRKGHRVNIVTDPLADPWPVISIRIKRETQWTMADMVGRPVRPRRFVAPHQVPDYEAMGNEGLFTPLAARFLHMAVVAGFSTVVIGATGVGKTIVLNALGSMIPADRRIITIESVRELQFRQPERGENWARYGNEVHFITRAATLEGLTAVTEADLVRACLRQRPDALTVGEARGAEVYDLIKALMTGHRGGLTSIHAESVEEVPDRIRMMLQEAHFSTEVTEETVAYLIAKSFQLAIMLRLTEDGRRYVEEISELTGGIEGRRNPVRNPLFIWDPERGRLCFTGAQLAHKAMLQQAGFQYDRDLHAVGLASPDFNPHLTVQRYR